MSADMIFDLTAIYHATGTSMTSFSHDFLPSPEHTAVTGSTIRGRGAAGIPSSPVLALFDFDGTLIKGDSLWHFLGHTHGFLRRLLVLATLLPTLLAAFARPERKDAAKEKLLARFYKGMSEKNLESHGKYFARAILPGLHQITIFNRMLWHKQQGHRVIVVSASPELWILPWCRLYGVEGLATRFSYEQGLFNGRFSGKNCNREEKTRRVREHVPDYERYAAFVYGDSDGDIDMLRMANAGAFRVIHGQLQQIA